jgi:hypothetical protein
MAAYTVPTIAITGSPKDYTGLVAARRRQKDADEAKAAADQKKADEEIYKALSIKPGEMLNARIPDAKKLGVETVKRLREIQESGASWADMQEAQQNALYQLQAWKDEKKTFDEADKRRRTGAGITHKGFDAAYTAKDSQGLQAGLGRSAIYDEQSGTYRPLEFDRIDLGTRQADIANRVDALPTGEKAYDFNGQPYELMRVDVNKLRKAYEMDFDTNELVRQNAINAFEQSVDTQAMKDEEVIAAARKFYADNGVVLAKGDTTRKGTGKGGINIDVNIGGGLDNQATPFGEVPPTTKIVTTNPISGDKQEYETRNYAGYSVGDLTITSPVPGGAVYIDSGEPVKDADLRTAKFNQFAVKVLLKEDWENPKDGHVYPKGSAVPIQFEDIVVENGLGEAGVVAMGLSNGQSVQYNAKGLNSSAFAAATEKEKPLIVKELAKAKLDKEKLQREINAKRKAKSGSPAPKPEPKPEPKLDNKRVNSNPALQKLLNQNAK